MWSRRGLAAAALLRRSPPCLRVASVSSLAAPHSLPTTLAPPAPGAPTTYHVAGWRDCSFFGQAREVAAAMKTLYPDSFDLVTHEFETRDAFRAWLVESHASFVQGFGADSPALTHTSSPFVWSNAHGFLGGCDALLAHFRKNVTSVSGSATAASVTAASPPNEVMKPAANDGDIEYDYDLVVIGGGSGGLAASKEAATYGAKVCVLDYVKPSPQGTSWGLGGTCVNVGCIPKKLMHQSSIIGEIMHHDGSAFGWSFGETSPQFKWEQLVKSVNNHIKGLNFNHKVQLRDKKVKYENFLGSFVDAHTLQLWHPKKGSKTITARNVIVAVGGRPRPLPCPGGDLAISSGDIFWRKESPGKTLVVGASYVALECAGFMKGVGYDVKIMVRSILLRGFDQDMANRIGQYMEEESNIQFIRECVPESIEKRQDGKLLVKWKTPEGETQEEAFDTVLNATGRNPDVSGLNLENAGVQLNPKTGRVLVKNEQTSMPNIFAIGDVIDGPELTPVAIKAGRLLAARIFNNSVKCMDYEKIPTTVFTPIEYGSCGLSEEAAEAKYGHDGIEIYHQNFIPLEWKLSQDRVASNSCYMKVIFEKKGKKQCVGFHYLGPNAGEVTQGIGLAMKLGFTYEQMTDVIGIHPTTAETFTTMEVTKSSGKSPAAKGC